jgi:phosphinothricin acetyltransferase
MYYVLNTTATFHARTLSKNEMQELVCFDNSKYKTFVMIEQGEVRGYVIMSPYKKREAYNDTAEVAVYLKHDKLGRGLGSLAVNYIEDYARSQSIHALIATICGENIRSIRAFEKNGYEKCAHYKEVGQKFGKLLDVVAYQKILN